MPEKQWVWVLNPKGVKVEVEASQLPNLLKKGFVEASQEDVLEEPTIEDLMENAPTEVVSQDPQPVVVVPEEVVEKPKKTRKKRTKKTK